MSVATSYDEWPPRRIAAIVGAVKHTHLRNIYLLIHADELRGAMLRGRHPLAETIELLDVLQRDIETGLNPKHLLSAMACTAGLSIEQRGALALGLDRSYQRRFRPSEVAQALKSASGVFRRTAEEFVAAAGDADQSDRYGALRTAVNVLVALLDGLPKGVWLPDASESTCNR